MIDTALWLTPLVMLPGVALLVLSTSARYAQIHEEFHHLLTDDVAQRQRTAVYLLARSILFRNALVALYISVGAFAVASLIGGFGSMFSANVDIIVIGMAFVGIVSLVYASYELIRESTKSLEIIREHYQEIMEESGDLP